MATPPQAGYIGIDAGTQGLSVVLCDSDLHTLAIAESDYDMVSGLSRGHFEQSAKDWERALEDAMKKLRIKHDYTAMHILGVGICGQMHGETLVDATNNVIGNVRLWCDERNALEAKELMQLFGEKVPIRMTCARYLWTLRNDPEKAKQTHHITTPAGWLAYVLTGEYCLGVGEASGVFPIDHATMDYDEELLKLYDELALEADPTSKPMRDLLPTVRSAGQSGGYVNTSGEKISLLPEGTPVAPAEGDQPASLAGSLVGQCGTLSMSFGTSVVGNYVSSHSLSAIAPQIDHFCAPDGQPINMLWLRNGTTFMNAVAEMFGQAVLSAGCTVDGLGPGCAGQDRQSEGVCPDVVRSQVGMGMGDEPLDTRGGTAGEEEDKIGPKAAEKQERSRPVSPVGLESGAETKDNARAVGFAAVMQQMLDAPVDCGGLMALPFMYGEPGLDIVRGGTAALVGLSIANNTPGNALRAALLSSIYNLRMSCDTMAAQGFRTDSIVLTGGLTRTPESGQIVSDVFGVAVTVPATAVEGCAWGSAVLAKYLSHTTSATLSRELPTPWPEFLGQVAAQRQSCTFLPNPEVRDIYESMFVKYKRMLDLHTQIERVMNGSGEVPP